MNPMNFFRELEQRKEGLGIGSNLLRLLKWFIPNGGTILIVGLLIFTQNVWAKTGIASTSAVGLSATTVNYQGRLANPDGTPVASGSYTMSFAIFDALSGGNLIWPPTGPETYPSVPVSGGLFNVGLGSQTAGGIPTSVWSGDRYLEISINGETLSPRELIRSVPIAGLALTVPDGSITQAKLGDDISFLTETSGTYTAVLKVLEGTNPTISPNTVTLSYKRIGSLVFVSVPLFTVTITGNPHLMDWSLPFPPAASNRGGEGSIYYPDGFTVGSIVGDNVMSFRNFSSGYYGSAIPIRGGFWYIAAP